MMAWFSQWVCVCVEQEGEGGGGGGDWLTDGKEKWGVGGGSEVVGEGKTGDLF